MPGLKPRPPKEKRKKLPGQHTRSCLTRDFEGARSLLDYWRVVEQSNLTYLGKQTDAQLKRIVIVHDAPEERYTVDGLLWHVMTARSAEVAERSTADEAGIFI